MIRNVRIQNFKSIPDLSLDLGRVNILIGANGSGKSNILEAIAMASAASENKLDNEFLASRGIRMTEIRFMQSAFQVPDAASQYYNLNISATFQNNVQYEFNIRAYTKNYSRIQLHNKIRLQSIKGPDHAIYSAATIDLYKMDEFWIDKLQPLPGFLIYAPENSALRTFQGEVQILPLGIRGEGLFAHLKDLNSEIHRGPVEKIKERLTLIDWFEGFEIPGDLYPGERTLRIRDRHLPEVALFDQRSANEGFLFLLFYLTLLISPETPAFFAIDNVDTSLNPKLCIELVKEITTLAKEYDKQVILTTHNPAILDGLDLHDDEQRLLVVDRKKDGHTRVRRIDPPKPAPGELPVSLSEAFMRGYIGGLPKNF